MMYGYTDSTVKSGKISISNGHTWLIDGYVQEKDYLQTKTILVYNYREDNGSTSTEVFYTWSLGQERGTKYYFHCNWGWDGDYDGYYLSNVFNTEYQYEEVSGVVYQEDYTRRYMEDVDSKGNNVYYKYCLKIACNIHK